MTEFRWLEMHMNDNNGQHPTAIAVPGLPYCRVLQMRELKNDDWWGDWQDIPVVASPT